MREIFDGYSGRRSTRLTSSPSIPGISHDRQRRRADGAVSLRRSSGSSARTTVRQAERITGAESQLLVLLGSGAGLLFPARRRAGRLTPGGHHTPTFSCGRRVRAHRDARPCTALVVSLERRRTLITAAGRVRPEFLGGTRQVRHRRDRPHDIGCDRRPPVRRGSGRRHEPHGLLTFVGEARRRSPRVGSAPRLRAPG